MQKSQSVHTGLINTWGHNVNRTNKCMQKYMNLMFCWPCIIIYQYSKTNEMHSLYSVYYELSASTCSQHYLLILRRRFYTTIGILCTCYVCWLHQGWSGTLVQPTHSWSWQSTKTYNTYQLLHTYIVTSWWWATSKPKTCRGILKINSATGWFYYILKD
jgi:hypothetical protein